MVNEKMASLPCQSGTSQLKVWRTGSRVIIRLSA